MGASIELLVFGISLISVVLDHVHLCIVANDKRFIIRGNRQITIAAVRTAQPAVCTLRPTLHLNYRTHGYSSSSSSTDSQIQTCSQSQQMLIAVHYLPSNHRMTVANSSRYDHTRARLWSHDLMISTGWINASEGSMISLLLSLTCRE